MPLPLGPTPKKTALYCGLHPTRTAAIRARQVSRTSRGPRRSTCACCTLIVCVWLFAVLHVTMLRTQPVATSHDQPILVAMRLLLVSSVFVTWVAFSAARCSHSHVSLRFQFAFSSHTSRAQHAVVRPQPTGCSVYHPDPHAFVLRSWHHCIPPCVQWSAFHGRAGGFCPRGKHALARAQPTRRH